MNVLAPIRPAPSVPAQDDAERLDADQGAANQLAGAAVSQQREDPVVIIGGGPAGIRLAQELSRRNVDCAVYNAERWLPYNRVKLTPLLCGDAQVGQIMHSLQFSGPGKVALYSDQSIIDVDRDAKAVQTKVGRVQRYSQLVFATGSRAHVPPIPGADLPGVYTFRNFDDVEQLIARSVRSRRTVIIGGGLLGLEAARGMANRGVETFVVEHEQHLMARQLDARAGALLAEKIETMGLHARTGVSVKAVEGDSRVERLRLSNDEVLECDTIILCTGVRANKELARDIGLPVGRAITVDASLQTADPNIYAIGECAEFNEEVCGLVGPAFDQAGVLARKLSGEDAAYSGSLSATKLKLVGVDIFSMGDVEQLSQRRGITTLKYDAQGVYRCIVLQRGHVIGAIAVGDWPEINRLQEFIRTKGFLMPWQRMRFTKSGSLWPQGQADNVIDWPR
ncbi:MAG: FAD-dependent oxidoreductase, partial [Pseudomonadota bacterium]